jgi:hypothetical protein
MLVKRLGRCAINLFAQVFLRTASRAGELTLTEVREVEPKNCHFKDGPRVKLYCFLAKQRSSCGR